MRTIETTATISPAGLLSLQVPPDILPGEHQIVLVINEQPAPADPRPPLDFPVDHYGPWPADLTLRRKDMYGDDGR